MWLLLSACTAPPPAETGSTPTATPAAATADTATSVAATADTGTPPTDTPPGCEIEDRGAWDQGMGWCPVTFAATLSDDGPVESLYVVFSARWHSGTEVIWEGPATSARFEWPNPPIFMTDDTTFYRLDLTDADGLVGGCEDGAWLDEMFLQFDADGDGYVLPGFYDDEEDCDDCDPSVHPGAPELPDGIDNDCNGVVDG